MATKPFSVPDVKVDGNNLFSASAPRSSGTYVVGGVNVKYNKNPERINIIGPTKSYIQAQVCFIRLCI